MTNYSFLIEANEFFEGGDNFFRDIKEIWKTGRLFDPLYNLKEKHPGKVKAGKIAVSLGSASYSYYLAVINALMAKKLSKIIKRIERINDRDKAINILVRIRKAPVSNELIDVNNVKDTLSSDYELSSKIIGPALQIINNKKDEFWKEHLLAYLNRQKKLMIVKASIIHPVTGTAAGVGVYKLLKK